MAGFYIWHNTTIGLRCFAPQLFTDIPWGTDQVLAATLDKCRRLQFACGLLPCRRDVDRPEDMELLSALL